MFDIAVRRRIDPALDRIARRLAGWGVSADGVTVAAFCIGAAAAAAITFEHHWLGLVLVLLSRLGDGLDGAVARASAARDGSYGTDFGGYLDIVLDFGFYALVPLAFVVADPQANAVAGAVLIAAFYFNGASFLAFATAAERRGDRDVRGHKAFRYTVGIMEGTETIVLFCAMCVFPSWFPAIAYVFAALTLATTLARIALARRTFR